MKHIYLLLVIFLCGCTVSGIRYDQNSNQVEKFELKGWGAKKASFANGASIEKDEPIQVPDALPLRFQDGF